MRRVVAVALVALVLVGGWLALDPTARERLMGDVPEARITDYLGATQRGDAEAARAVWKLRGSPEVLGLADRRTAVTNRFASERARLVRIVAIEWWTTCCEPHVVDGPRNAGLARATVLVRSGASEGRYVFDVLARSTTYWGDAAGNEPHEWTLRDVYDEAAAPLFFRAARPDG